MAITTTTVKFNGNVNYTDPLLAVDIVIGVPGVTRFVYNFAGDDYINLPVVIPASAGRLEVTIDKSAHTGTQTVYDSENGTIRMRNTDTEYLYRSLTSDSVKPNTVTPTSLNEEVCIHSWDMAGNGISIISGVETALAVGTFSPGNETFLLIGAQNNFVNFFQGVIRDIKYYDAQTDGNLIHHWKIDDNSTTIVDSVGTAHGTLIQGTGTWSEITTGADIQKVFTPTSAAGNGTDTIAYTGTWDFEPIAGDEVYFAYGSSVTGDYVDDDGAPMEDVTFQITNCLGAFPSMAITNSTTEAPASNNIAGASVGVAPSGAASIIVPAGATGKAVWQAFVGEAMTGRTFAISFRYRWLTEQLEQDDSTRVALRVDGDAIGGGSATFAIHVYSPVTTDWQDFTRIYVMDGGVNGVSTEMSFESSFSDVNGYEFGDVMIHEVTSYAATATVPPFIAAGTTGNYAINDPVGQDIQYEGDSFLATNGVDFGSFTEKLGISKLVTTANVDNQAVGGQSLSDMNIAYVGARVSEKLTIFWEGWSANFPDDNALENRWSDYNELLQRKVAKGGRFLVLSLHAADLANEYAGTASRIRLDELNNRLKTNYPLNYVDTLTACVNAGETSGNIGDAANFANGIPAGSLMRVETITSITDNTTDATAEIGSHSFNAGDSIVIQESDVAGYIGDWLISSVGATSVVIPAGGLGNAGSSRFRDPIHLSNREGYQVPADACMKKMIANGWDKESTPESTL